MKLTIYGAGYVGLITGVCLADLGHEVVCADIDTRKIDLLKNGGMPIYEKDLEHFLRYNLHAGRIRFTTDLQAAVHHGDIHIIGVGTPSHDDGSVNVDYVNSIVTTIAQNLNRDALIVIKSTVPVGTYNEIEKKLADILTARDSNVKIDLASNPEFLREGSAIYDFMHTDRIVIGVKTEFALQQMRKLYEPLIANRTQLIVMEPQASELTKYAVNSFLATKISFINQISQIAEIYQANIKEVKAGMISDSRIGTEFLNAGCGFGGACFPKDVAGLLYSTRKHNLNADMLQAVLTINKQQQESLYYKVKKYFNNDLNNKTIALWGLAFKPCTDDIRYAPSCTLMELFWQAGVTVQAYDPMAMDKIKHRYPDEPRLTLVDNPIAALYNADVLLIVTEWDIFRQVEISEIKKNLRYPVIFDGRNMFDYKALTEQGVIYIGIGYGDNVI